MRVAIIKSNYTPYGGAEKYTTLIANAFVRYGAEVDILTSRSAGWEKVKKNINIVKIKTFPYNNLLRLLTFNKNVRSYLINSDYDCILGMERTDYQTHLRTGGGCHIAYLKRRCEFSSWLRCMSFSINPFHIATIRVEKKAFLSGYLKRIICNSEMVRKEIGYYYPETYDKTVVIHNGVEWNEMEDAFMDGIKRKNEILKSLHLPDDRFYFLFVGSGYRRKGLYIAIKALKALPHYASLIVVGKDKNEKRYKHLAERVGLEKRIYFLGPQKNVLPLYQISDAFVLPTIYDPFSNASLEALAMGLFTITSSANGCAEVIKDRTGYVINDLHDMDSLIEGMKIAMSQKVSKKEIRDSVRAFDISYKVDEIVKLCIEDSVRS